MFNIIRYCEAQKNNKCINHYSNLKTANNDPSITRKMRYAHISRNGKYKTITRRQEIENTEVEQELHFHPMFQVESISSVN
jgi:hypothetical protein